MILTDSNILIDYFRSNDEVLKNRLDSLEIAVCGPVKTELFHGAQTDDEIDNILKTFSSFELLVTDEYDWEFAGLMLNTIRKNGFSIPVTDALIAYLGIKYDVPVWTKDKHFKMIQAVFPELKLYSELQGW